MVIISKISVHEKKRHYYSVTFLKDDGKTWELSVHEDVLVAKGLRKGMELTQEELAALEKMENENGAYQSALNYLGYRMRSEKEMYDYLIQKEFSGSIASRIISRLKKEHLLDDLSFAKAYVRTKMNTTGKGPLLIYKELLQKGIAEKYAKKALDEYPADLRYHNACRLAEKKLQSSGSHSYNEKVKRITAALIQKGFDRELVSSVIQDLPKEESDQEWEALIKQAEKAMRKVNGPDQRTKQYKLRMILYRKGFSIALIDKYINENLNED